MGPTTVLIDDVIDQMIFRWKKPNIVLAEDDAAMRQLLATSLRADGYEVVEARSGIELIRAVQRFDAAKLPVGLIITDVRMPGFTGLEVLEYIRYAKQTTPVIVITAFGDEQTHAEAWGLDAADVLDKPLDIDVLRASVRRILQPAEGA